MWMYLGPFYLPQVQRHGRDEEDLAFDVHTVLRE